MSRCGLLTLAVGRRVYLDQAVNLALSTRLHGELPISLVTDSGLAAVLSAEPALRQLFDHVLVDDSLPKGPIAKIFVDQASPYDETIFVDADCLLFGKFGPLPAKFLADDFAVFGKSFSTGQWGPREISDLAARAHSPSFPRINSGVFAWRKGPRSGRIFNRIRQLYREDPYAYSWDLKGTKGLVNDEPLICAALAMEKIAPISQPLDGRHVMLSTINAIRFQLDVRSGSARFLKEGRSVSPWFVHFCELYPHAIYVREINSLREGITSAWNYPDGSSLKRRVGRTVRGLMAAVKGNKSTRIF